jgi:hypothetical protein
VLKGFVHNCIVHPLWWIARVAYDLATVLHDSTDPGEFE